VQERLDRPRGPYRASGEVLQVGAAPAPNYARNVAQGGDALALLRSLPDSCTRLVFFDPQHRENLDHLKYGNEGARQAAGSFVVMHAAHRLGREFIGCDLAHPPDEADTSIPSNLFIPYFLGRRGEMRE